MTSRDDIQNAAIEWIRTKYTPSVSERARIVKAFQEAAGRSYVILTAPPGVNANEYRFHVQCLLADTPITCAVLNDRAIIIGRSEEAVCYGTHEYRSGQSGDHLLTKINREKI